MRKITEMKNQKNENFKNAIYGQCREWVGVAILVYEKHGTYKTKT